MKNKKYYRVTEAARELGVSPQTIRNWTNNGIITCDFSPVGHRIYKVEYINSLKNTSPDETTPPVTIFYARSSTSNDVTVNTQIEKLTSQFGQPDKVFTDKSSGLNDKRRGLHSLFSYMKEVDTFTLYVTNKDRLARFGFPFIEEIVHLNGGELIVLDSDETKEPQEILMQDFLSLLASFSGKFYRLRGWEQRKKFLKDVNDEVKKHGRK